MNQDRNLFQLGLTVIVVTFLLVTALIFIGGSSFQTRVPIVVHIAHDQKMPRLKSGAPVICGPQQVGTVTSVKSVEAPWHVDAKIKDFLYFEVRADVDKSLKLRSDCEIVVEGPLLGDNGQLTIENRGRNGEIATDSKPILARSKGIVNELSAIAEEFDAEKPDSLLARIKSQLDTEDSRSLLTKVHTSLDDINSMTLNLKRTVDPGRSDALVTKIDSILSNFNELTATLRDQMEPGQEGVVLTKLHLGLDQLNDALQEIVLTLRENRPGIRDTVAGTERITRQVNDNILPAISDELDRDNAMSLLNHVHAAIDQVNTALADVVDVAGTARRTVKLSEPQINATVNNIKEASGHLKILARDLRLNPWRLIHQPDASETKERYVLDAVREFVDVAAQLDRIVTQVTALMESDNTAIPADDPTLLEIRQQMKQTLDKFSRAEQTLWSQLNMK